MSDARTQVHDEVRKALSKYIPLPALRDVSDEEIEAALDDYEAELNLEFRVEHGNEVYVASEIVRRIMIDRGLMIKHHKAFDDEVPVEQRYPREMRTDDHAEEFLDALQATQEDQPTSYGELIARYVELTDGLLADLAFLEEGDPLAGEDVRVVCERADEQFTTSLETTMGTPARRPVADVDGLVNLLNEVVAATTDAGRRFFCADLDSSYVGVFFLDDQTGFYAEDYFPVALTFHGE